MPRPFFFKISVHLAIIFAWGLAIFFLMEKEGFFTVSTDEIRFSSLIPDNREFDLWKSIYVGNQWIGYNHTIFGPSQEGYRISSISHLRFKMLNEIKNLSITGTQDLDRNKQIEKFEVRISGITGIVIRGRKAGSNLIVDVTYGSTAFQKTFEASGEFMIDQSLLQIYRGRSLKPDEKYRLRILNPLTLKAEDVSVRVVGKEKNLTIMETRFAGLLSTSWIDEEGMVVREETPNGWIIKTESRAHIRERLANSDSDAVDLLKQIAVLTDREIKDPRSVTFMKIRLKGFNLTELPADGKRQKIDNWFEGTVTIEAGLSENNPVTKASIGKSYDIYLEPSTWIDSNDQRIVAVSEKIIGEEKDPVRAAELINDWLYANIKKKLSPELPVATTVLETMQGDCNEHTSLFVAIARAAGIPARMSAGLVWSHDAFYYHAWPSIYAGHWIHLDPTLGQHRADATHIELVSGDFSAQSKIALAMGKIGIEIIEYR